MEPSESFSVKKENSESLNAVEGNQKLKSTGENNSQLLKTKIKAVTSLVKELEDNILEANQNDKEIFKKLHSDNVKNQILSNQLEDAKKENKQLINILQQRIGEQTSSRTTIGSNLEGSFSTISMVNLQYKYEELLANYEGLLKVLEAKGKEINKCYADNEELKNKIKEISLSLVECQQEITKVCQKYLNLKQRKDRKIEDLQQENKALRLAHDNLVDMLSKSCMEQDREYQEELRRTKNPSKALLLNEIRRVNRIQHENNILKQEVEYLREKLKNNMRE